MSKLSDDAFALMWACRDAVDPTDEDQARIRKALLVRLGDGAWASQPSARGPAAAKAGIATSTRIWLALGVPVVGIGLAWSIVHRGSVPESTNVSRPAALPTVSVEPRVEPAAPPEAPASPLPQASGPPVGATTPSPSAPLGKHRGTAKSAADTLSSEVALLGEATMDLNRGQPAAALDEFEEHERRFPSGALAEERMAGQVEALCALGRTQEAKLEASRLVAVYPRSSHLKHVLAACGWDAVP